MVSLPRLIMVILLPIMKNVIFTLILSAMALMPVHADNKPSKLSAQALYAQFQNPDSRYRPFVRWWWNGDAVVGKELVRELHLLRDAGIGGVEINPISLPYGADQHGYKQLTWLSQPWLEALDTTLTEARRIGMTCDLLIGSGWPFGSETLPHKDRASVLLTAAIPLTPGRHYEFSKFDLFKRLDPGVSITNSAREPRLEIAYLVPDSINDFRQAKDVTAEFANGNYVVDTPAEGKYQLYAMVRFDSFASVINGAPGAAGSILDHMNAGAVRRYLDNMYNTIETKTGPLSRWLRSFFVDSMELEGTNWTDDFREEFKRRRGYDVMPWLPFTMFKVGRLGDVESYIFGAKKGPDFKNQVDRVRYDFELTKAELLQERYTNTFTSWCKEKGVKSRAQAYGRGFFPLESSLSYDIPEGESWTTNWLRHRLGEEMGDKDYRRGRGYTMIDKYVSSAAHLTGKRLVSCEEMTNTYLVFNTPLELIKIGTDMSAFSGVTHSVWHGFNYSPRDVAFPGWVQYGSYYNEKNTWFPYWKYLNNYRARVSSILQNVDMQTDIAILPPNADLWTEMGVQTEPFPRDLNVTYTSLIWEAIHKNGGGADYLSDSIIEKCDVRDGHLCYGPKSYSAIFLPDVKGTTQGVMDKLLEFVRGGGRVFCIGTYPQRSLGLKDYQERDAKMRATVDELKGYADRFVLLEKPQDGKYLEWYRAVMDKYQLSHAVTITNPDRFVLQNRYKADDGSDLFFFANVNLKDSKQTDVVFPESMTRGKSAWLYDPADGKRYTLKLDGQRLHLDMGPAEAFFVVFNDVKAKAPVYKRKPLQGEQYIELGNWTASLHHSREGWVKTMAMPDSLQDLKNTEYSHFMGDITYTTTVNVESGRMPKYLNLGRVCEIAEVKINGRPAGVQWFGDRVIDVEGMLHAGANTIEVKVTTLMGNYMHTLKDNKVAQRYVIKRNHPLRSMGLLGPVRLYE